MAKKESKSKSDTVGGLVFVGPLMIGIGLGVGFLLIGLVKAIMKD